MLLIKRFRIEKCEVGDNLKHWHRKPPKSHLQDFSYLIEDRCRFCDVVFCLLTHMFFVSNKERTGGSLMSLSNISNTFNTEAFCNRARSFL